MLVTDRCPCKTPRAPSTSWSTYHFSSCRRCMLVLTSVALHRCFPQPPTCQPCPTLPPSYPSLISYPFFYHPRKVSPKVSKGPTPVSPLVNNGVPSSMTKSPWWFLFIFWNLKILCRAVFGAVFCTFMLSEILLRFSFAPVYVESHPEPTHLLVSRPLIVWIPSPCTNGLLWNPDTAKTWALPLCYSPPSTSPPTTNSEHGPEQHKEHSASYWSCWGSRKTYAPALPMMKLFLVEAVQGPDISIFQVPSRSHSWLLPILLQLDHLQILQAPSSEPLSVFQQLESRQTLLCVPILLLLTCSLGISSYLLGSCFPRSDVKLGSFDSSEAGIQLNTEKLKARSQFEVPWTTRPRVFLTTSPEDLQWGLPREILYNLHSILALNFGPLRGHESKCQVNLACPISKGNWLLSYSSSLLVLTGMSTDPSLHRC